MPKQAKELSALAVSRLNTPGLHFVGGVPGLALQVTANGARSWILRATIGDKRRDMGLGRFSPSGMTLARAREQAVEARLKIARGIDPIEDAETIRKAMKAEQAAAMTFDQCAAAYIDAHESGWTNKKHAQQWTNTLATYASPEMGSMRVREVGLPQVLKAIEPIWRTKTETASRVRNRIELVLDWATAHGHREGLNPARWTGHLDKLLPRPSKVTKTVHHGALPFDDVPNFMKALRAASGMGARALEFAILTAARSGEVRGALWQEIDLDKAVWTVPADRMKMGKEHRVPLSDSAAQLLRDLPRLAGSELVFHAPRGGQLSDMTLSAVLRRMKTPAVPHGFRSSFRDWSGERTEFPNEMCELALAHSVGNKAEAAYRRGDMFERRREMMNEWSAFCGLVKSPFV